MEIDSSCVIHPFYIHKMDSGPVRLMTIAHANGQVTVMFQIVSTLMEEVP